MLTKNNYDHALNVISAFLFAFTISLILFGCSVEHENCAWEQGINACLIEVRRTPLDKPTKAWIVKQQPGYGFYPLAPDESNFLDDAKSALGTVPVPTLPVVP